MSNLTGIGYYLAITAVGWTIFGSRYHYRKALGAYKCLSDEDDAAGNAIIWPIFWPISYPFLLFTFIIWPGITWPGRMLARRTLRRQVEAEERAKLLATPLDELE